MICAGKKRFQGLWKIITRGMQERSGKSMLMFTTTAVDQEMPMRLGRERAVFKKSERRRVYLGRKVKLDGLMRPRHRSRNAAFPLRAIGSHGLFSCTCVYVHMHTHDTGVGAVDKVGSVF